MHCTYTHVSQFYRFILRRYENLTINDKNGFKMKRFLKKKCGCDDRTLIK